MWRLITKSNFNFGIGIGWRPELALFSERFEGLGFVEILAEDFDPTGTLPLPVLQLRQRGVAVLVHGVSLSLGGAEMPDVTRVSRLAQLATKFQSPLVSEHIAFVRADGIESGHLLPVQRSRQSLNILVENIHVVQQLLPVPLALENISTLFEWPNPEMDEQEFVSELLARSNALLVLDIGNVYANASNHGWNPTDALRRYPLERLAYVHVGGGMMHDGIYHDTHAHAVPAPVFDLLEELCALTEVPGVMLERDDRFPNDNELTNEMNAILIAMEKGSKRRQRDTVRR
jgi:hypothetical protein